VGWQADIVMVEQLVGDPLVDDRIRRIAQIGTDNYLVCRQSVGDQLSYIVGFEASNKKSVYTVLITPFTPARVKVSIAAPLVLADVSASAPAATGTEALLMSLKTFTVC
jgi:hypothetical protein